MAIAVWERIETAAAAAKGEVQMKGRLRATLMSVGSGCRALRAVCGHALAFQQLLHLPIARLVQALALEQQERNRFERPKKKCIFIFHYLLSVKMFII